MTDPHADLPQRVAALRAWCEERIRAYRIIEAEFTNQNAVNTARFAHAEIAEVLARLGYPVPPRDESPKEPG